jgi:DNA-directed RNA polymerase beta' subunit
MTLHEIASIEFTVLPPDEIRKIAVVDVREAMLYERGLPRTNSVIDLRMGSVDRRFRCSTCKNSVMECNGHFGKIELASPMINPVYIESILKVLRSVCFWCSNLVLDPNEAVFRSSKNSKKKRLAAIALRSKQAKRCAACGGCQPAWSRFGVSLRREFSGDCFETEQELQFAVQPSTTCEMYSIMDNIRERDQHALGFQSTRPVWMLIEVMLCPPVIMRPSIASSESSRTRGHDDLTLKLQDIVKSNHALKQALEAEPGATDPEKAFAAVERAREILQINITMYLTNDIRTTTKTGAFAATVRRNSNLRSLSVRLRGKRGRIRGNMCGKRVDFSSRSVIGPDPNIDVDELGVPISIACSQTVACTVFDANASMMRACVNVGANKLGGALALQKTNKRRISLVNMDSSQRAEIADDLEIGDIVHRHLQDNDIVLFNRQPSLHMFSIMSHKVRIMPGSNFRLSPQCTNPYNADFDGDEMNMHTTQRLDATAEIRELMSVANNMISPQKSNPTLCLIQDVIIGLYKLSDEKRCVDVEEAMQHYMSIKYPTRNFFSSSSRDVPGRDLLSMIIPLELFFEGHGLKILKGTIVHGRFTKKSCAALVATVARDFGGDVAVRFISDAQRLAISFLFNEGFTCSMDDCFTTTSTHAAKELNRLLDNVDCTDALNEEKAMSNMQHAMDVAGTLAERGSRARNFSEMISSGSKGTVINKLQIQACVGQQTVSGQRILAGGALPSMLDSSHGHPTSHGFVTSSYRDGLRAHEYFFHLMGGREGLVDTAVKTARTGYIERRVVKFVENACVTAIGSVVNANGDILQTLYGGDGLTAEELEEQTVPGITSPGLWPDTALGRIGCAAGERVRSTRSVFCVLPSNTVFVPGSLTRWRQKFEAYGTGDHESRIDALRFVHQLPSHLQVYFCWVFKDQSVESRMVRAAALWFELRCEHARVPSGYSPGIVAAQAMGHPITQMTLNTFHFAGRGSSLVSAGVPRLAEIMDLTSNVAMPCMRMRLHSDFWDSSACASALAAELGPLRLEDFVNDCRPAVHSDADFLQALGVDPSGFTFTVNLSALNDAGLTFDMLLLKISTALDAIAVKTGAKEAWTNAQLDLKEILCGLPNVRRAVVVDRTAWNESTLCEFTEYAVETLGINLPATMAHTIVDHTHTTCTSVKVMYDRYGIEATMNILYRDFVEVLGDGVHARHLMVLIDSMCFDGYPNSINRHGLAKTAATPLHRAAFEETIETLMQAALSMSSFDVVGITEQIMMGCKATIGSGVGELITTQKRFIGRSLTHEACLWSKPETPPGSPVNSEARSRSPSPAFRPSDYDRPEASDVPKPDDGASPRDSSNCAPNSQTFVMDYWHYSPHSPRPTKRFRPRSPSPE